MTKRLLSLVVAVSLAGCALAHERPRHQAPVVRPMDLNGDGYGDLAVGSEGAVYVYFGGPHGIADVPDVTITSPSGTLRFGQLVACAGDVDGDGFSDLLIGDPDQQQSFIPFAMGEIIVVPGSSSGPDLARARWLVGDALAQGTWWVPTRGPGDVDGDRFDDITVGALVADDGTRVPRVLHGARDFFAATPFRVTSLPDLPPAESGHAVPSSWVGDLDGDGRADIFLADAGNVGRRHAFLLSSASPEAFVAVECLAASTGLDAPCGLYAGPAGDVDGDGVGDVAVLGEAGVFRADMYETASARVIDVLAATSVGGTDGPVGLSSGGDLDGDGLLDTAIGLGFRPSERVQIAWGDGRSITMSSAVDLGSGSTSFGELIDINGDLNRDGRFELIVYAEGASVSVLEIFDWGRGGATPDVHVLHAPSDDHASFGESFTTGR